MEDPKFDQPTYSSNLSNNFKIKIETTDNLNQDLYTCYRTQENDALQKEANCNDIKIEPLLENDHCSETLQNNIALEIAQDSINIQSCIEKVNCDVVNAYDLISIDDKPIKNEILEQLELDNTDLGLKVDSENVPMCIYGKGDFNLKIKDEILDEDIPIVEAVNPDNFIKRENNGKFPSHIFKSEPEYPEDGFNCDDLLVPDYEKTYRQCHIATPEDYAEDSFVSEMSEDITQRNARNCKKYYSRKKSANQGVVKKKNNSEKCRQYRQRKKKLLAQQLESKNEVIHTPSTSSLQMTFEPQLITTESPSKKLRTQSKSSLTTDNMVMVNSDITQKSCTKDKGKNRMTTDNDQTNKGRKILEPALSCTVCNYKTWNKAYMELHTLTHQKEEENIVFPCVICDYITKDKQSLTKHLIEHNGREPFRCIVCGFECNTPSGLLKHSKNKHPDVTRPYSCNVCEYKSSNNSAIIRHTRIHTGEKPFACKQCPYRCTDSSSLTFHMMQHTGEKPYSCKLCPYRSKCNSTLISHMRRHTGERPFECQGCQYKFTNQSDLMQHMKINAGGKAFRCSVCDFSSTAKCALVKHVRSHTGYNTLTCEVCMYKCTDKQILEGHMKTHSGASQYSCTNCDFLCSRKCDLLMHMRTHTEVKPFSCTLCDYKCRGSRTLANHVKKTHIAPSSKKIRIRRSSSGTTDNNETKSSNTKDKHKNNTQPDETTMKTKKKYSNDSIDHNHDTKPCGEDSLDKDTEILEPALSCEDCTYRTWNKDYMRLHRLTHIKGEGGAFPCIICDYVTDDEQLITEHLISHNGKMPFRCMVCDFKCNTPSGLLKHNTEHHKVTKPFACNICAYKSSNNSAIIRHTRIHTGEKPYSCSQCTYRCTDGSSLTYHMRQHTGEKTYK